MSWNSTKEGPEEKDEHGRIPGGAEEQGRLRHHGRLTSEERNPVYGAQLSTTHPSGFFPNTNSFIFNNWFDSFMLHVLQIVFNNFFCCVSNQTKDSILIVTQYNEHYRSSRYLIYSWKWTWFFFLAPFIYICISFF